MHSNQNNKNQICVIDPYGLISDSTYAVLRERGYGLTVFPLGQDAARAFQEFCFNLMIIALDVPEADVPPTAVIKLARSYYTTKGVDLPIITLASEANHEENLEAIYAGASQCVTVPIDENVLLDVIEQVFNPTETRAESTEHVRPTFEVCLIESDALTASQIQTVLKSDGHSIRHFNQPKEALQALTDSRFDRIVCGFHPDHQPDELIELITTLRRADDAQSKLTPCLALTEDISPSLAKTIDTIGVPQEILANMMSGELLIRLRHLPEPKELQTTTETPPPVNTPAAAAVAAPIPTLEVEPRRTRTPSTQSNLLTQLSNVVLGHSKWVIAVCFLCTMVLLSGMFHFSFSSDYRVFFSDENPQLQAFDELEATYTQNNIASIILAPADGNVFTRETLAAVEELTEAAWQVPYSSRIDSITNFQHSYAKEDELVVESLVEDPHAYTDEKLASIHDIALNSDQLVGRLVSPSGHVTAVGINILLPRDKENEAVEVAHAVRKLAAELRERHPHISTYITGPVMMDTAFFEATINEMLTQIPAMYVLVSICIALLLRSVYATIATMILVGASTACAMGAASWMGIVITTPSAGAPIVILTLAVADSVHILSSMFESMRDGKSKAMVIAESIRINFQPILITSVTTAIGFLSMNFSDAPPFRDLGNIVAIGVMSALVLSLTLLPALLNLMPIKPPPKRSFQADLLDKLALIVIRERNAFVIIIGTLVIALGASITQIELNDNFVEYFDDSYEFRRDTDFAQENIRGLHSIEYSIPAGKFESITQPEYLVLLDRFAAWYETQPGVTHVDAISETFKRLNKNMHDDDATFYQLPESRELSSQYLLLYELSLPRGLDLTTQVNLNKSASRVSVTLNNISMREIRALEQNAQSWMSTNFPADMQITGTGGSLLFAHISERNISSMLKGTSVALVLISALLIIALRSFKIGLISLIPNLVPAIMAFGLWGLFLGEIGLAVSVVTAMTLGIVVDDTVHFLSKYLRFRREHNMNAEEAVRLTFRHVGLPLVTTTIVLALGFLVLATSSFGVNADMGLLTTVTIVIALLTDLLLLPAILMNIDRSPTAP